MTLPIFGIQSNPFMRSGESNIKVMHASFVDVNGVALYVSDVPQFSLHTSSFLRIHAEEGGCMLLFPPSEGEVSIQRICMLDTRGEGTRQLMRCQNTQPYNFSASHVSACVSYDSGNQVLVRGQGGIFANGNFSHIEMPTNYGLYFSGSPEGGTFTTEFITISRCVATRFIVSSGENSWLGHHLFQKCNLIECRESNEGSMLVSVYRGSANVEECVFIGNNFTVTVGTNNDQTQLHVFNCLFDEMALSNVVTQSGNQDGWTGGAISHEILDMEKCFRDAARTIRHRTQPRFIVFVDLLLLVND